MFCERLRNTRPESESLYLCDWFCDSASGAPRMFSDFRIRGSSRLGPGPGWRRRFRLGLCEGRALRRAFAGFAPESPTMSLEELMKSEKSVTVCLSLRSEDKSVSLGSPGFILLFCCSH